MIPGGVDLLRPLGWESLSFRLKTAVTGNDALQNRLDRVLIDVCGIPRRKTLGICSGPSEVRWHVWVPQLGGLVVDQSRQKDGQWGASANTETTVYNRAGSTCSP